MRICIASNYLTSCDPQSNLFANSDSSQIAKILQTRDCTRVSNKPHYSANYSCKRRELLGSPKSLDATTQPVTANVNSLKSSRIG